MNKMTIILFLFLLQNIGFGQDEINYQPKLLNKEIKSVFSLENFDISPIDLLNKNSNNGRFFIIEDQRMDQKGIVYIGRIFSCRADGCDIKTADHKQNASEYFDYFILFNNKSEIVSVRVYNYQATHGQEVSAKSWLKKFRGYNGEYSLTGKNSVDIISGATVSSNGIINDLQYQTTKLNTYLSKF